MLRSFSATVPTGILLRFGAAFLAAIFGLLIASVLDPFTAGQARYLMALGAVAFSSWYCGLGPSIVCVATSLLGLELWLRRGSIAQPQNWVELFTFLTVTAMIVAFAEASRREKKRLHEAAEELEQKVLARTNELSRTNESLRELTARLLNLQDEERRRIARELHDNAGQSLSVLAINLGAVANDLGRLVHTVGTVADSAGIVKQMSDDIRTMSYLLHPPMLDEMGLVPALRLYVEGFAERTKIAVQFDCAQEFTRQTPEVETAVFRVVQECLTNVLRHSGSATAAVQLAQSDGHLQVEVSDSGKGLSSEKRKQMESGGTLGVGIRGMRERAHQLGGTLEVGSNEDGTRIVVRLPAAKAAQTQSAARAAKVV